MRPEDQWADPPLRTKVAVAWSAFGWLIFAAHAAGSAAWLRRLRRVVRAG